MYFFQIRISKRFFQRCYCQVQFALVFLSNVWKNCNAESFKYSFKNPNRCASAIPLTTIVRNKNSKSAQLSVEPGPIL